LNIKDFLQQQINAVDLNKVAMDYALQRIRYLENRVKELEAELTLLQQIRHLEKRVGEIEKEQVAL
jgi:hypothetical protein